LRLWHGEFRTSQARLSARVLKEGNFSVLVDVHRNLD
jgi:hypothetical protein